MAYLWRVWGVMMVMLYPCVLPECASAATQLVSFTITPFTGGVLNSSGWYQIRGDRSPFGMIEQPILSGNITFDTSRLGSQDSKAPNAAAFAGINYRTGTKIWTVSDIGADSWAYMSPQGIAFGLRLVDPSIGPFSTNGIYNFTNASTVFMNDGSNSKDCDDCLSLTSSTAPNLIDLVYNQNDFDSSKPTVVITHGWRPGSGSAEWEAEMADDVRQYTSSLVGSNIIQVYWNDAITPGYSPRELLTANAKTQNAGSLLAKTLYDLSDSFQGGIQFIGHSLGSYVNAYAANALTDQGLTVDQFTILDRPFGRVNLKYDDDLFRSELPKDGVVFVDNYFGTGVASNDIPGQGYPFSYPFVAKNIEYSGAGHSEVHDRYADTIFVGGQCGDAGGFSCSIAVASQFRAGNERWDPGKSFNIVQQVGDATNLLGEGWNSVNCVIRSAVSATCSEGSPAYLWNDALKFDPTAEYLAFDINWLSMGDGDWITVSFGDNLLYSFLGIAATEGTPRSSGLIPVTDFAGQSGQFTFALNSVGERNASFSISNLRFLSSTSPIPEPANWILLIFGFSIAGARLRFSRSMDLTVQPDGKRETIPQL